MRSWRSAGPRRPRRPASGSSSGTTGEGNEKGVWKPVVLKENHPRQRIKKLMLAGCHFLVSGDWTTFPKIPFLGGRGGGSNYVDDTPPSLLRLLHCSLIATLAVLHSSRCWINRLNYWQNINNTVDPTQGLYYTAHRALS